MPATFAQQHAMKSDTELRNRVEAATAKVAMYIITAEPANTPNSRNRRRWAENAAGSPEVFVPRMMWAIAGNGAIQDAYYSDPQNPSQAGVPDGDIEYVVNVMVDSFATGV